MEAFLQKVQKDYSLTDKDIKYLKFTFTALLYDISKMVLLFVFFFLIDKTAAFLLCMSLLVLLRGNHGGLHTKHYFSCLLLSFFFLVFSICIMPAIWEVPKPVVLVGLTLCILIHYQIGPVRSEQCHVKDPGIFNRNQFHTFIIIFAFLILSYLLPSSELMTCGFWIIVAQSVQLVIAKYIQQYKRKEATT